MGIKNPETKKRMSLYLTPSLKEDLKELAASEKRTISNMIEILIFDAVEKSKKALHK